MNASSQGPSTPDDTINRGGKCSVDEPVASAEVLLVAVLTLIGLALRLKGMTEAPGFWYDEAIYALDGLDVLTKPGWPVFFDTEGHMREGMFMYFLALAFKLCGVSVEVARGTSAVIGALTIPAMWFMGREFGGRRSGLLCAILLTFLCWHLHFSSLCFRTILTPLFGALTAGMLCRFARRSSVLNAVASGALLGLGAYTYLAWRLVPVILVVFGIWALWTVRRRAITIPSGRSMAALVATAGLVFLPLAIHFISNPGHFHGRTSEITLSGVSVYSETPILGQARDVALTFAVRGDSERRHNILGSPDFLQLWVYGIPNAEDYARWQDLSERGSAPDPHGYGLPVFDVITGIVFYLGILHFMVKAWRGGLIEGGVVLWIVIGSLASVLSFGAPNLLRLTLLIPSVVFVLAAAIGWMLDEVSTRFGSHLGATVLVVVLLHYAAVQVRRFHAWPRNPLVPVGFNVEFTALSHAMRDLHPEGPVVLPAALWDHATIRFGMHDINRVPDTSFQPADHPDGWIEVRTAPGWPPLQVPDRSVAERSVEDLGLVTAGGDPWCRIVRVRPGI